MQVPPQPAPPTLTPVSAEFESTMTPPQPGAAPHVSSWKMARCADGKTIMDQGDKTVITDPKLQQSITLDHLKKEALVMPMKPAVPGMPSAPPGVQMPQTPGGSMSVENLGKQMIGGHEADGQRFTFQPPQMPQMPSAVPQAPGMPQVPRMPPVPGMPPVAGMPPKPGMPPAPAPPMPAIPTAPHLVEVWTSSKLHVPLLIKSSGSGGQQTTACKQLTAGEPPRCAFKIPSDYKIVQPPALPNAPTPPR